MLEGYYKKHLNRFWESLARVLVIMRLTPNQVTWLGLFLLSLNCAAYVIHQNPLIFGIGLAFSFAFDALDGAVARLTDTTTLYGGYLDAVVDRYQEILLFSSIAFVTGFWIECFFALNASLLISYNKARVALEIPIENVGWPDLLERLERIIIICTVLILEPFIVLPVTDKGILYIGLLIIAVLGHVTAIQRFLRARQLLQQTNKNLT
jgi:phosphatidylglycerophosphate synthase